MKVESEGRDAACSVRFVFYGRMLPPASQCIVSVVLCFADAVRCIHDETDDNKKVSLAHNSLMIY